MQGTMKPSAKIICDSISEQGHRLVTMEVVMHRFILAEMNTHRVFSRNSASSRAIPASKIQDRVFDNPADPVHWGAEIKGMQSGQDLVGDIRGEVENEWQYIRSIALDSARRLTEMGLHKSLVNRLLEPFMWHTAIITATEWDNFFWQRCDPAAQPEMKAVADEMQRAYYTHRPDHMPYGAWHLPYISIEDMDLCKDRVGYDHGAAVDLLRRVSVARCARVSYLNHDGTRDIDKDLALFDKLKTSGHWSPFEHVATPVNPSTCHPNQMGNFVGWKQYRKEFQHENRKRFIPNLEDLAHIRFALENGADVNSILGVD